MEKLCDRPYVLTIAGFDPTGGAGLVADCKTFEQLGVMGLSVCTAVTVQTEEQVFNVDWLSPQSIINQLNPLLSRYPVEYVKVGIIQNWEVLSEIVEVAKKIRPNLKFIVDPVLGPSMGTPFHNVVGLESSLMHLALLTPNVPEMQEMTVNENAIEAAVLWSAKCPVLLKGGHSSTTPGTDLLIVNGQITELNPLGPMGSPKHGTGCCLSAAITAQLANGQSLENACLEAKKYVYRLIHSNQTLLAYHANS
ncbi:hydroxymethylpyrimidine/phosphomethylpyrimidine kinase [Solitalea lacus]|uniref:hydroxymethylpyrimidine/phosphomethylpyrimidine kinase n=1 Tax=Solitalea lacus TaxID=2911172 RepID=UPI001EDBBDA7|nr:hydroxymethylpyrimidine/phosphomethylpyrimidine kinase [Solitalea lacus]UKJ06874.1 hydroxymethylpyrimidine/phosphomethylpyrimidine kinase [Solitalea lacus]